MTDKSVKNVMTRGRLADPLAKWPVEKWFENQYPQVSFLLKFI
jgi:hypothetical protein